MTGEEKPTFDLAAWLRDEVEGIFKENHSEFHMHWQIACILRRAADLPYSDTPASGWQEEGTPEISWIVLGIVSAKSDWTLDRPKEALDDLYKLKRSLRDLKRRLLSNYSPPVFCGFSFRWLS